MNEQSCRGQCALTSESSWSGTESRNLRCSSQGPSSGLSVCMYLLTISIRRCVLDFCPFHGAVCGRRAISLPEKYIIQEKRDVWDCIRLSFSKAPEVVGERFHSMGFLSSNCEEDGFLITCFDFHDITASIIRVFIPHPCCCFHHVIQQGLFGCAIPR